MLILLESTENHSNLYELKNPMKWLLNCLATLNIFRK